MKLYIDPGTGSMLFTVLIGIIGASIYSLRMFWIKIRFALSGGKAETNAETAEMVDRGDRGIAGADRTFDGAADTDGCGRCAAGTEQALHIQ